MTTKPLIDYFEKLLPLNEEEKSAITEYFKERRIKRKQFLLQAGDICNHSTFIIEGCFRTYMVDKKGKEHNLQFAAENWWIGDISSFHSGTAGRLYIQALENSLILQCKKEDQYALFINYPKFNHVFRVLAENAMVSLQNRILLNISSTAEERYLDFLTRYPDFFNRISNVQIASFLGVTPEFLSAIRKKLAES